MFVSLTLKQKGAGESIKEFTYIFITFLMRRLRTNELYAHAVAVKPTILCVIQLNNF